MGLIAYALFAALPTFTEFAFIGAITTTVSLAPLALFLWQPDEADRFSTRDWAVIFGWFWVAAVILFVFACWLRDVSLDSALGLPPRLWEWRLLSSGFTPFWAAMTFGPGATILVIGSLIRLIVLRLGKSPLTSHSRRRAKART